MRQTRGSPKKSRLQAAEVMAQLQLKISGLSDAALTQLRRSLFRAFPGESLEKDILGRLQCRPVGQADLIDD
jgi:hypothetical protein